MVSSANLVLKNCSFSSGNALEGGAIYIQGEANVVISGCVFEACTSTTAGGAISANQFKTLSITDGTVFTMNFSDDQRGDSIMLTSTTTNSSVLFQDIKFQSQFQHSFLDIRYLNRLKISRVTIEMTSKPYKTKNQIAAIFLNNVDNILIE